MVWRWGAGRGAVNINDCVIRAQLTYVYKPPPSLLPAPALPPIPILLPPAFTAAGFALTERADPVRLPWAWAPYDKTTAVYAPTAQGKWWSQLVAVLAAMGPNRQRDWGHIGWIMETELGVELVDGEQCVACQASGGECQVYFKKGAQQVRKPRDTLSQVPQPLLRGFCGVAWPHSLSTAPFANSCGPLSQLAARTNSCKLLS